MLFYSGGFFNCIVAELIQICIPNLPQNKGCYPLPPSLKKKKKIKKMKVIIVSKKIKKLIC